MSLMGGMQQAALERARQYVRDNPRARKFARRAIREIASAISQRHYEAARKAHRTENWLTTPSSANSLIGASLATLRDRSRDLQRNNPYGHRYPVVMANNIIGENLSPYAQTGDKEQEKILNGIWTRHAPRLNADGSRIGAQTLFWQGCFAMIESGEVFAIKRPAKSSDGLEVPVQIELLESDLLDQSLNKSLGKGRIINGVELDARRKIEAYHFFENHPGDNGLFGALFSEHVRVPAADVAHLYFPTRPGQRRGIPWMSAAMIAMRDLDDYRDAERIRKKVEASLTAFVIGGDDNYSAGGDDKAIADVAVDADGKLVETFEPGLIAYLRGDKRVEMNKPTGVGGYNEYVVTELHAIAAALLIPYVLLTSDLTKVNYSSIRAGMLEFYRLIKVIRKLFYIPLFAQPIWDWTFEAAYLVGKTDTPIIPCTWNADKFESIDPLKAAQADIMNLQAGTRSLFEIIAEKGRDPYEVIAEMAKVNEELAENNMKFSWQAGSGSSASPTDEPEDDEPDDDSEDEDA